MTTNKTLREKFMPGVKDIVFIIMFLTTVAGWIRSETRSKVTMEVTIENITKVVENNTKAVEKVNDFLLEQNKLNGQITQHLLEDD